MKWRNFLILTFLLRGLSLTSQTAKPYDILINEFLPDPSPAIGLPNSEYVELFNRSNTPINLFNFKIYNGNVSTTLPNFILKPKFYVTIYTKKTGIDFGKFGDTIQVSKLITLSNPNDTFYLAAPNGEIIDVATYDLTYYDNSYKSQGGWSLERIGTNSPCNPNAWTASNDLKGGTPSQRNSVAVDSIDKTPPKVERYFLPNNRTISVVFDKRLDKLNAEQIPAYTIIENIDVKSVKIEPPLFTQINITLKDSLKAKQLYHFILKKTIIDCKGIPLSKDETLDIQLPEKPIRNDLIINELLFNPEVGGSRFIEIFNNSKKVIDVYDLKIGDISRGNIQTVSTHFLLFPQKYVVFTDNPRYIMTRYKADKYKFSIIKNKLPTWNDKSGNATIYTVNGSKVDTLDSFSYESTWHNPFLANLDGVSIERINPDLQSNNAQTWQSAAESYGYASPAQANSQYRDVNIPPSVSEAFSLEKPHFSPDDDGFEDALLIYYKVEKSAIANIKIFDREGRLIKTLVKNELLAENGIIRWNGERDDNTKAVIGVYILATEVIYSNQKTVHQKIPFALLTHF